MPLVLIPYVADQLTKPRFTLVPENIRILHLTLQEFQMHAVVKEGFQR
jgi:hypothetical protein